MEYLGFWIALLLAAALAAGGCGVAVGFFREAQAAREQIDYLRQQLAAFMPRDGSRALTVQQGGRG